MTRIVTCLDLETTGLCEPEHRIIEMTLACYDLDTGVEQTVVTWRIDPLRKIEAKAQRVHGIAQEDVTGKPTFDLIAPKMVRVMNASTLVVAHNGDGFDFPFIDMELRRVGITPPVRPTFDTCTQGRWATPYGKIPSLRELAECCEVPFDPALAHGAEYDTRVLAACFFKGREMGFFPAFERMAA